MANKILLLSNAQKTTLEAFPTYTETALPQIIGSLTPGTFNVYRLSDVVTGTVTAAASPATFKSVGTYANGSSGTTSVNWPTHVAGDVGLLVEVFRADATPDALSAGWTQLCDIYYSTSSSRRRLRLSWKRAASGAETAASLGASAGGRTGVIVLYDNCVAAGTPCELIGSKTDMTSVTAVTIPSGGGPTQDASLIVPIFVPNQPSGGASLLSGVFVNADLTSITTRSEYPSPGQNQGIYIATGNRADLGVMADTTATITSAYNVVSAAVAFYPA